MRIERWYWLGLFALYSTLIHGVLGWRMPSLGLSTPAMPRPTEIEVSLNPEPVEKPAPPKPEPVSKPLAAPKPSVAKPRELAHATPFKPRVPKAAAVRKPDPVTAGGTDPTKVEQPLPLGLPTGRRSLKAERTQLALAPRQPDLSRPPSRSTEELPTTGTPKLAPRMAGAATGADNPLAGSVSSDDEKPLPLGAAKGPGGGATRFARSTAAPSLAGGGSPSPAPVPGGRDGLRGPDRSQPDLMFLGGGAGGKNLPREAPRIGGGGGRTLLSVTNPLARDLVSDEKAGLGPGVGGGAGLGAAGGVGSGRGAGVGTNPAGRLAISTLRAKPGSGLGAGSGSGIGTAPPGGGRGTGADLPGTGGTGAGYGRGSGIGFGSGSGPGIATGGGGRGGGAGSGTGTEGPGGSGRLLTRGIPFGDITGLLGGNPNGGGGRGGGPGGSGRGLGGRGTGGGGPRETEKARIVYLLDASGSMNRANMIGKAKDALKKAISELKQGDFFNIIAFSGTISPFHGDILPATPQNIEQAYAFIDRLGLAGGTNISAALEAALLSPSVTHVFILSDGEPSRGIVDTEQLRAFARQRNRASAQIHTLGLGLGEEFPGIPLLKSLAADNDGSFNYINLAR